MNKAKKLIFVIIVASGFTYYYSQKENPEVLLLENVEALAANETVGTGCYYAGTIDCVTSKTKYAVGGLSIDLND